MVLAKLIDGTFTHNTSRLSSGNPLILSLRLRSNRPAHRKRQSRDSYRPRKPRATMDADPALQAFSFDCMFDAELRAVTYRPASGSDLPNICKFVDFWLAGGAKRLHIPGGGSDFFVPKGQQIGYLKYKTTYLAMFNDEIIGWAVKSKNKTLIHLLVTPEYRGRGIGGHLLSILDPELIRSKSDQSTGNPKGFYERHGYEVLTADQGKHHNIDIMQQSQNPE